MRHHTVIRVMGALVVVAVALFVMRPWAPKQSHMAEEGEQERAASHAGQSANALDASAIERVADLAGRTPVSGSDQLRSAVADALLVYSSGTADDFLAYLESYGVEPPQSVSSMPKLFLSAWERQRGLLAHADIDLSNVRFLMNPEEPKPRERFPELEMDPADIGTFHATARRDGARGFLQDVPFEKRQRVRVTIPGSYLAIELGGTAVGQPFQAELSFEFTLNPETGQWVLTELRMDGEMSDGAARDPGFML